MHSTTAQKTHIQVSHNELITLCAKAFIGLNKHCGEADIIAQMVADLEMVGLDGIKHFVNALQFIENDHDLPIRVDNTFEQGVKADLKNCSIICHLPNLLDFALEKLAQRQTVILQINHCHNRWLSFGELLKLSKKGLSVKACWNNGSTAQQVIYILDAHQCFPELYLFNQTENDKHSLTIEISKDTLSHPVSHNNMQHISSSRQADNKHNAWKLGMSVSQVDWAYIQSIASHILVESSEISHRGAGGDHQPLIKP